MPTVYTRPKGIRAQTHRRLAIERSRRWAEPLRWPPVPSLGWLTEVRVASGLSTRDVAARLGVSQSAVVHAEASERRGTIRLAVLRRYADAMDADVRYVVVPRASVLKSRDSQGRRRRSPLRLRAHRPPVKRFPPLWVNEHPEPIVISQPAEPPVPSRADTQDTDDC
jgi:transcriptional regulator with XRE-family HTH domain